MAEASLKDGLLRISSVEAPTSARPGDVIRVNVNVINGAGAIYTWDEDRCSTSSLESAGYLTVVELLVEDTLSTESEPTCIPLSVVGVTEYQFTFDVEVPNREGRYNIHSRLKLPRSDSVSNYEGTEIQVSSDAPKEPGGGDDDDDDGGGDVDLLEYALKNPVKTGAGALGLSIVIRQIARGRE